MKVITHMSKTNRILLVLVIVLAAALGAVLYWQKMGIEEKYSAVYLNTGDIYFGKLSRFPRMTLRDVWFLQKESEAQGFALSKFENAFWAPRDKMIFNEENVVWVTELAEDSEVVRAIKNPQSVAPTQTGMMPQTPINEVSTTQENVTQ